MWRLLGRRKSERERRDELLSAYLDGELDERERQRLEARLAQDATLRAELRALHQTVSLVQELPQATAPRNFILSKSMVERRQPAPRPEPEAIRARPRVRPAQAPGRAWAAPLLTAATVVVSLLFAVVLVGDMLLPRVGTLSSAPRMVEQSKEVPQVALEAAPTDEGARVEREVEPGETSAPMQAEEAAVEQPEMPGEEEENADIEAEGAASPTPSTLAMEAPAEEPEMALEEEEKAAEEIGTGEAPPETGTPPAPTGGGGATEEAATQVAPTVVPEAALTPTIPPEAAALDAEQPEEERGLVEPAPDEIEVTPYPIPAEEEGLNEWGAGRLPWEALEIGLGLAVVVLVFTTIRAWRVRRG